MAGVSAGSSAGGGGSRVVRWLTDLDKTAIVSNFEKRGWVKGSLEGRRARDLTWFCLRPGILQMVTGISTFAVCTLRGPCSVLIVDSDWPTISKIWNRADFLLSSFEWLRHFFHNYYNIECIAVYICICFSLLPLPPWITEWSVISRPTMSWPERTVWSRTSGGIARTWREMAVHWQRETKEEDSSISV